MFSQKSQKRIEKLEHLPHRLLEKQLARVVANMQSRGFMSSYRSHQTVWSPDLLLEARSLMTSLGLSEGMPVTDATALDKAPDNRETDEPKCPVPGTSMVEDGKHRGKQMAFVYQDDKSYIKWVRDNINTKSSLGMQKLKLYVLTRDEMKTRRMGMEQEQSQHSRFHHRQRRASGEQCQDCTGLVARPKLTTGTMEKTGFEMEDSEDLEDWERVSAAKRPEPVVSKWRHLIRRMDADVDLKMTEMGERMSLMSKPPGKFVYNLSLGSNMGYDAELMVRTLMEENMMLAEKVVMLSREKEIADASSSSMDQGLRARKHFPRN
jgi:hypothetical protein